MLRWRGEPSFTLRAPGIPWLVAASFQCTPLPTAFSCHLLFCFLMDIRQWIRAHLNLGGSHAKTPTSITFVDTLFQIRSHPEVPDRVGEGVALFNPLQGGLCGRAQQANLFYLDWKAGLCVFLFCGRRIFWGGRVP